MAENREKLNEMTKGSTKENRMGTAPVNGLLLRMSFPLMVSMFVQSLYNIVDSIFVSRINENALTAVSLSFPVQQLMLSFAIGTALGMSALISRYLGAKQFDRVNKVAQHGIFLAFMTYLLFFVIGFFARPFIAFQTDDPQIIEYGGIYLHIVCWLSIMVFAQITLERLLQSTGKTIYIFFMQATGALINIIMDPILIFGLFGMPKMGIAGAATATVFGQTVGVLMGLYFNKTKNKELRISMRGFRPSTRIISEIYQIGVPAIIMQSVGSVMVFLLDLILVSFSTTAVATFGAYFKLQSFVFMPVFGMNNGVVPLIAYNYGAWKKSRMQEAMRLSSRYAVTFMTVGMILFWLFPKQLLGLFAASEQMLEIGVPALRIISLGFPLAGYAIMKGSVFQALGKSIYSMYTSIVRQLVVLLPVAFVAAKMFGTVTSVWVAFPIAEVVGLILTIYYARNVQRELIDPIRESSEN